jgi:hypothetical protein
MNKLQQEVVSAIDDIKVQVSKGKKLNENDLEVLFLAALLEEDN